MKESVAVAKEADAKKGVSPTKSSGSSIQRLRDEPERQLGSLRGVLGNIRRDGGKPSVESIATQLSGMHTGGRAPALLALQQTHGNQYVQRVVSGIQAKLVVGQPGDIYEQEADRVADAVMRMPEPMIRQRHTCATDQPSCGEEEPIQTKTLSEQITPFIQRQKEEEEEEEEKIKSKPLAAQITPLIQRQGEEKEEEPLMTKSISGSISQVGNDLQIRLNQSSGCGQLLPEAHRSFMERRFGIDFSGVMIHTDSEAVQMNRELNAQAFTIGQDIYFGYGRHQPNTKQGQQLLAHELTHVVQQTSEGISYYGNEPVIQRQISLKVVAYHGYNMFPPEWHIERARDVYRPCDINVTETTQDYRNNIQITKTDLGAYRILDFPGNVSAVKQRAGASGAGEVPLAFAKDIRVDGRTGYAGYTRNRLAAVSNLAVQRHIAAREIARFFGLTGTNGNINNLLYQDPNRTAAATTLDLTQCNHIRQRLGLSSLRSLISP